MNKYIIRHKTLGILCDKHYKILYDTAEFKDSNFIKGELTDVPLSTILDKLKITEYEFRRSNSCLAELGELKYRLENDIEFICLGKTGICAYEDQKYKRLRIQIYNEIIYSYIKWMVPIAALIISVIALLVALTNKHNN